jgi:hypothetical protein
MYFAKYDLEFVIFYRFLDLGHQLHNYELTLLGKVPYVDFWANWWAPASFYLNALAFRLFGVSIYSANLLLAIVMIISTTALFCISERVMPKPIALAVALVSLLWGNLTLNFPYSGWYASCFGLLALLGFIKYLESTDRKLVWLVVTGMGLGLTFSSKQHIGALNSLAIAVATAVSVCMTKGGDLRIECKASGKPSFFRRLLISCYFILLLPGHVIIPFVLLRARYSSEGGFDAKTFVIFFLPFFIINLIVLMILFQAPALSSKNTDYRALLITLIKREMALAAGFILVVAPWFMHFSNMIGWGDFYRLIFLIHPIQENFVKTYFTIMPALELPYRSVFFFFCVLGACTAIISMFTLSKSKKTLSISIALSAGILVVMTLLAFPIDPQLGQTVHFPSDFDTAYFVHCENPKLIGQMCYFLLLVEAILLVAMLMKSKGRVAFLLNAKESFVLLSLALFSVYNLMTLISFVDRAHLQMILFPWLALIGYAAYLIYSKICSLMPSPDFASGWRRTGIVVAVALFFLVQYVGKALFIVHLQYFNNKEYSEYRSRLTGKNYKVLSKITGHKGGVYVNDSIREQLEEVVEYMQRHTTAEEYVFGAPGTTMFNFLADREFPSKYSYLIFNSLAEEEKEELLKEIEKNKPKLYIFDDFFDEELPVPGLTETEKFIRDFPAINEHISKNFEFDKAVGRFHLYRKQEPIPRSSEKQ